MVLLPLFEQVEKIEKGEKASAVTFAVEPLKGTEESRGVTGLVPEKKNNCYLSRENG